MYFRRMKNEKQIIYILTFMWFYSVVDFMLLMPFGSEFMDLYGIQPDKFSMLIAAYSISAGISAFMATFYIDKYDRKNLLLLAFLCFAVGSIICSFAYTFEMMLFGRFFTGTFGGILGCVTVAIISDIVPYKRRGAAMGTLNMSFGLASIIGIPLGLVISKYTNEFMPFRIIGVLALFVLALAYKIIPPLNQYIRETSSLSLKEVGELFLDKNLRKAFLFVFFLIQGHFMFISFLNPFLQENLGFDKDETTLMYVMGGLSVAITSAIVGKYIDIYGKLKSFIVLIICSFIPVLVIAHLQTSQLSVVLFFCTLLFIFSSGRMIAAMTLLTGAPTENQRSKFLAIRSAIIEFSEGISVTIGGLILTKNSVSGHLEHYSTLSYITVVIGILCIFLARKIKIAAEVEAMSFS
jgi:predicted MFS family arabinose efflux permease